MATGKGNGKVFNNGDPTNDSGEVVLKGGRGDDIYVVSSLSVRIDEKKNGGIDQVFASVDYSLDDNVEFLTLEGDGDLSGTGNDLDNVIAGNSGANFLDGRAGDDQLSGGIGDDSLIGGSGADFIDGGDGFDTVYYSDNLSTYSLEWANKDLWITDGFGDTDILRNVELLFFADQTMSLVPEPEAPPAEEPLPEQPAPEEPVAEDPPPPPPAVASDDIAVTNEDQPVTISILDNDSGVGLTVTNFTNGAAGTVSISSEQTLIYTPDPDSWGSDTFSYTVIDSTGALASATVSVTIAEVNDAPGVVDDAFEAQSGETFVSGVSVLSNDFDVDGDILHIAAFDTLSEQGGTVQFAEDGSFTYLAADGFSGTDRFSYTASDGRGGKTTAMVEIAVLPPPDPTLDPTPLPPPPEETQDSDYFIAALMAGDWYRLNANEAYGTGAVVTYAFATETPDYYDADSIHRDGFLAFDESQQANTREALDSIEAFSGLTFIESTVADAEMVFGFADIGSSGLAYWPTYDGTGKMASDVWLDDGLAISSLDQGSEQYGTLIHEIGHAIGLTHPILTAEEENQAFTIMADPLHPTMGGVEAETFMQYDIATLQYLYGANDNHAAGDDTYTFAEFDGNVMTLWDGGGYDTIDLSGATQGVALNLSDGAQSTISATGTGNLTIAIGTSIEAAVGSAYDDRLAGNALDNTFTGGSGSDIFAFDMDWGQDTVTDFVEGEDFLDFSQTGLVFEALNITMVDGGVVIENNDDSVFLDGITQTLSEGDFLFG
ncbi:Ig-like domain-containing protein [uncultured Roseovarius sp.]|uniref:Ig-like domain-containing protein n=1 Tax=Roseovarius sp. TaxID=1486281 RepID=UPI0025F3AF6F|nr:Ig-like domain-containing protein [uncultured Roseovarius sp.]